MLAYEDEKNDNNEDRTEKKGKKIVKNIFSSLSRRKQQNKNDVMEKLQV